MPIKRANDFAAYEDGERTGRGRGCGDRYQPWLRTSDVTHSNGSRCRMYSAKCGRVVHLLSHAEHKFFVHLDWLPEVVEIQEQFPLDPEETQAIAKSQGVRHPGYSFGGCVMTTDFRVRWKGSRGFYWTAFQVKSSRRDVESKRAQEKLEIEREYWKRHKVPWEVVFASDLDAVYVQNLLLLVPYRNELCTKQDLQYLLAFFNRLRNRFPDADASQLAEADIRLPSQRVISAWDAVALLAGKQLIEVPVKEKDLFVCTMQDFEVKHVS